MDVSHYLYSIRTTTLYGNVCWTNKFHHKTKSASSFVRTLIVNTARGRFRESIIRQHLFHTYTCWCGYAFMWYAYDFQITIFNQTCQAAMPENAMMLSCPPSLALVMTMMGLRQHLCWHVCECAYPYVLA